jgi:Fuc2NAc and GlcNAc transferase
MTYLFFILLFLLSCGLTYYYIRYAWRHKLVDIPNARSSHTHLTPRGGGLVFIGLWFITSLLALFFHFLNLQAAIILLPGALLVAITGFFDDRYNISTVLRALAYLSAAIIGIFALGGFTEIIIHTDYTLSLGLFGSIAAVLFIFWSINLFNFMDGLDGVAATEALFILGVGGFLIAEAGGYETAMWIWSLAVLIAGFLVWNKPPAKVFMGDVGSTTLGFVIAMIALWSEKKYGVPLLVWFMLYGVFLVDTTLTVLRRLLAGERAYQAHRLHAYQRLNQAGLSHTTVLVIISSVNILLAIIALAGFYYRDYLWVFGLMALILLLLLYLWAERVKPMYTHP